VTATHAPAPGGQTTEIIEPAEPAEPIEQAESPEDPPAAAPRKRAWWRRALSWVTTGAVLGLLALGIVLALIPAMNGGTALTVLSGSMQPTLKPGDVVVVFPVDGFDDVELGDVVTFMPTADDPTLVTHRAKAWGVNGDGEKVLITRGDANGADDSPLREKQLRAKVAYSVPWVGNVLQYTQASKPWLVLAVAVILITYAIYATVTSFRRR
jgi:signal peptidase